MRVIMFQSRVDHRSWSPWFVWRGGIPRFLVFEVHGWLYHVVEEAFTGSLRSKKSVMREGLSR